MSVLEM